jgi:hypothetical protein
MKTIFDLCQPRGEIPPGSSHIEIFGTRIKGEMKAAGEPVFSGLWNVPVLIEVAVFQHDQVLRRRK